MDYLKPVLNALAYIEYHLKDDIKSEDVAKEAAFSKFHFHRIFLAVTGNTITGYIRRRRLTEATVTLAGTDRKIIDIAFDFQFDTPESFLRAFKTMYGVTPSEYRNRGINFMALHQPRIDQAILEIVKERNLMEATIRTKNTFKIVGMRYYGDNQNQEIKQLWDDFLPKVDNIKNRIDTTVSYGICYPEEDQTTGAFEYIAAVEVSNFDEIPEGMVSRTIPEQKYAVFTHRGSVDKITEAYQAIYAVWQPKSGYELIKAPDFEYYDDRFDPDNPEKSELDINIPIK
jgi:AraC family transcriptional regulator